MPNVAQLNPLQPKIIGYAVLIQSTSRWSKGPYLHMDDTAHDTLAAAIDEAYYHWKDKIRVLGIFSVDQLGNFATVYNERALDGLLEGRQRDEEREYPSDYDQHNTLNHVMQGLMGRT
jgi:hypothetical protein